MTTKADLIAALERAEGWEARETALSQATLADRIEYGRNAWGDWCLDDLCRELEAIDPRPNVNGTCAGYLQDLQEAKRFIPPDHLFGISHDVNEVRAVVALILTERGHGFSAVRHGPHAEERALVAAALRAGGPDEA